MLRQEIPAFDDCHEAGVLRCHQARN
jgi:hypothetical protein